MHRLPLYRLFLQRRMQLRRCLLQKEVKKIPRHRNLCRDFSLYILLG